MKENLKIAPVYLLTLLYFIVSWVGIQHHELFIDEAHHWLLARDSTSLSDLIANTRIEGHPILWNALLYGITRWTTNVFWMQFVHIVISTSVVFLFLRKAPFSLLFKSLFIFGYFMLFEYNLISRNYMIGVLFLFLACSIFKDRNKKFVLLSLYLALAVNTHLMFSIVAIALFLTILLEQWQKKQWRQPQILLGTCIFGLGLLSIFIQIHSTHSGWLLNPFEKIPFHERLVKGFISLFKGLITVPDFRTLLFWNTNFFVNLSKPISSVFGLILYVLPLFLFFKNRKTLFFVYIGIIGAQVFFYVTQRGAVRFHGMNYVIIIMALWIENYFPTEKYKLKDFMTSLQLPLFRKPIIYSLLTIQFCSGIYAYTMDYKFDFTAAKSTLNYLEKEKLNTKEIVSVTCDGTLISAYLEKKVYFLCDGSLQSFCHWDSSCAAKVNQKIAIEMLLEYMKSRENVLFVSYYPLTNSTNSAVWEQLNDTISVRFVQKFDQTIVEKSNYFVFEVTNKNVVSKQ